MKKACEPQKDSRDTMRKLGEPKLSSRHIGDLNAKNHKNLTINIHKQSDEEMSHAALELERLRTQVEERDKEIAALRQAAKVKDRKLDQLNNRCRKEQLRQYYRFMELEPVVELEEDSGGGDESPTSSGPPSLSPPPYMADIWAEDSLYSGLLREHLELQRSHHALELRLKRSEARARQLQELRRTSSEQVQQLQAEVLELRELNELLEFRILELEEGHDPESMARSPGPDTRDVCTDTENDDVSDSGVVSLPTSEEVGSDTDLGVHDLKIDLPHEELRERLLQLARSSSCNEDKCCVRQVLSLLEDFSPLSPLDSPDLLMARTFKNLSDCTNSSNELTKSSGRIVATVLPFNELSHPPSPTDIFKDNVVKHPYSCLTKQAKSTDSLQESGIFESDSVDLVSKSTQTDGPAVSGDLNAEIRKLTQFRERIEEERAGLLAGSELAFCRERLRLMEDKVRVYESSGEQQATLLAERLQRELALAAQVKELSAKVTRLQAENSKLDEERCELEEAENDTRLRCQRLEAKLQALSDRTTELQTKLHQERRANGNLKFDLAEIEKLKHDARSLETVISKYEERNYELEERQVELIHKLEMWEVYWPAVLLWIIWRTLGASASIFHLSLTDKSHWAMKQQSADPSAAHYGYHDVSSKLRELEYEGIGERQEAEGMSTASDTEYRFELQERNGMEVIDTHRIKEIESGYLQRIQELEDALNSLKEQTKEPTVTTVPEESVVSKNKYLSMISSPTRTIDEECRSSECAKRLQELTMTESELKARISELQQKEAAYMETLQQADDLWSEMENDYQKQVQELKASEAELQSRLAAAENKHRAECQDNEMRVSELEQTLAELQETLQKKEEDKTALSIKVATLTETLAATESALEKLQREVDDVLRPQLSEEQRLVTQLQKDLAHKNEAMESLQDSYDTEIQILRCQLSAVKKEYMHANCECDQLKAEVQTLEKTILDQREYILEQKEHNEKTFITLTTLLEAKDKELEHALLAARDAQVRSARDELEEAMQTQEESIPIVPPPRTKRGSFWRRASLQEGKDIHQISRVIDSATTHSKDCSKCSQPMGTALQTIFSQVRTLSELLNCEHFHRSPVPQIKSQSVIKEDVSSIEKKTDDDEGSSSSDTTAQCRKPTWLTEVSININECTQPVSSDVKRSIMYWDDLSSHTNNASCTKVINRRNRVRVLGRSSDGDVVESPTI